MPSVTTSIVVIVGLILLLGVPFTLWWWKLADKWADAEHRRFRDKKDERERVVVDDEADGSERET
ncbi:MAG: hypothetical protein AB7Q00_03450 [Phycisphaerales bacterium]|nr:MAG: hypothetical protein IPK69_08075 [Phycisphaerales bacterium]